MFGYVTIYRKGLAKEDLDRYQAYYCGLCQALGNRYGLSGRMALSYDLAFVSMLLSALYEPQTQFALGRCVPHPLRCRPRASNEFQEYAADMTVLLAYYNLMDDWQDEHRRASFRQATKLQPFLHDIQKRWPRQWGVVTEQLAALRLLEASGSHELDALCNTFGTLLGAVFDCRHDEWSSVLQAMGHGLGGFIYLMDAYDDLEKDRKKGQFNALQALADELSPAEYEERCHELLTQQMGLCAQQFSLLPILRETPEGKLLYNTIYSGVWSKYALVRKHREGRHA